MGFDVTPGPTSSAARTGSSILIAMPVYNDWQAVQLLCSALALELRAMHDASISLLLIDDGSTELPRLRFPHGLNHVRAVDLLSLRRNLGHQRAIAVGLAYVHDHIRCDAVVVMDADGEDKPSDVGRLIAKLRETDGDRIVFAERGRRMEHFVFRVLYLVYRSLHRLLTGYRIRFGNFSVVPTQHLSTLVVSSELWSHYAATVLKTKIPFALVRADKGQRLAGRSRMNLVSMTVHGLTALSVFQEIVGTRVLLANAALLVVILLIVAAVVAIRLFTNLAIPGWATYTIGFLVILIAQLLVISLAVIYFILSGRNSMTFVPVRDYGFFVRDRIRIYPE